MSDKIKSIFADKKKIIKISLALLFFIVFAVFLYFFNQVEKPELVSTNGRTFETAVVTEIVKDNIQEDGSRVGNQYLKLKMLSGDLAGQTVDATSANGNLFGAECKVGMRVVTVTSISGDVTVTSVYSQDRQYVIYIFVIIFMLIMCIIGGKNGIKSVLGLVFTFVCIIFLYLPMIFRGFSPFFAAIVVVILTTFVSMLLIGGYTKKTFCAISGTVAGVVISGLSAAIFGYFAGISGYNVSDIESLLFIGQSTNIDIGGLLFSGILIASLGAVMDVGMSVSSTINEIHLNSPNMTRIQLFKSGINVGRDMMGTMSNTLILAFTGSSLSTLLLDYTYNLPYLQIINSYSIGIEIMQGLSGTIGVILTVPITSAVTAFMITNKKTFSLKKNKTTQNEIAE